MEWNGPTQGLYEKLGIRQLREAGVRAEVVYRLPLQRIKPEGILICVSTLVGLAMLLVGCFGIRIKGLLFPAVSRTPYRSRPIHKVILQYIPMACWSWPFGLSFQYP